MAQNMRNNIPAPLPPFDVRMDDLTLIRVFNTFSCEHGCGVDQILCNPEFRRPFVDKVRAAIDSVSEEIVLARIQKLHHTGLIR